jgi:hypothetical protein
VIGTGITLSAPIYFAAILAGLVGTAELVGRYRDAPLAAARTVAGVTYILLHAAAAAVVYQLIHEGEVVANDQTKNRAIVEVITAAFGTVAFLRSSFFTVRLDGKDVGLGPALLWQTLLDATDRAVDRARAQPRSQAVREIMVGIDFVRAAGALPEFCYHLMQNVSGDERKAHAALVSDLLASQMDPLAKTYNLGLSLMNIVGERVLREAVKALGTQIRGPATASIEVIARLARVDFARDAATFAQACATISGQPENEQSVREIMDQRVQAIAAMGLGDQDKLLLLAIELLNRFGDGVVSAALTFVGKPATTQTPAPSPPPPTS